MDRVLDEKYLKLKLALDNLLNSSIIWDMTNAVPNDDNRSSANRSIERKPTKISYQKIPFLNSVYEAMCFKIKMAVIFTFIQVLLLYLITRKILDSLKLTN